MIPSFSRKIKLSASEEEEAAPQTSDFPSSAGLNLEATRGGWRNFLPSLGILLVIVFSGILTGYLLSARLGRGKIGGGTSLVAPGAETKGKEVGSADLETFKDTATGVLEKGGVDGEGTHKLIREGGPSQTAYLISTVIDLDSFVGKKVQVWGETFSAQKAGWLMDVGRVKILE